MKYDLKKSTLNILSKILLNLSEKLKDCLLSENILSIKNVGCFGHKLKEMGKIFDNKIDQVISC